MKLWRINHKGSWPETSVDVIGNDLDDAIMNFDCLKRKEGSMTDRQHIIKIELISDFTLMEESKHG